MNKFFNQIFFLFTNIIEGSALYPELVKNLVSEKDIRAIFLTGSEQLFRNRIYQESNFNNVGEEE
ncbi:MAG: hypothetical protein AAFY21_11360, partial [Cyanobacteria bacterium J06641_2]